MSRRLRWIDTEARLPFHARVVKNVLLLFCLALAGCATTQPRPYQVVNPKPPPIALDRAFQFRKIEEYFLDPVPPRLTTQTNAAVAFERNYRLFGAITSLDQHMLYVTYFDFYWRATRDTDVRLRLEYRQEKLHALVQAREVRYAHARGHHHTEVAIIGDDFFDDGRVIAWRASLIVGGRIVALSRSYLWE